MGNGGLWICISLVKLDFWIFLDVWDIFLGKGGKVFGHLIKYGEWGIVDMADHESAHTPTSLPEYIFLLQLYLHSTCLISYSVLTFDILTRPLPRQCCTHNVLGINGNICLSVQYLKHLEYNLIHIQQMFKISLCDFLRCAVIEVQSVVQ